MKDKSAPPENAAKNEARDDMARLADELRAIGQESLGILQCFMADSIARPGLPKQGETFVRFLQLITTNPVPIFDAQISLWRESIPSMGKAQHAGMVGLDNHPVIVPGRDDRRFRAAAWEDNIVFDFIKQSYLLAARALQDAAFRPNELDERMARKIDFYTRQFVDAMAPTNFLLTNPEILQRTFETRGHNLVSGLRHLIGDIEHGKKYLRSISTDPDSLVLGTDLATSPGKIIWRNELFELIQYAPSTERVARRPLLVVPSWSQKFYIFDLRARSSFVRWLVDQGFTVFMISWINPTGIFSRHGLESYLTNGLLAAMGAVTNAIGEREMNVVGYCLGGTLLSCALAHLSAKGDRRCTSASFFASLLDHEEVGELSVYIDEEQLRAFEQASIEASDAAPLHATFQALRANDLVWSLVVRKYLLGEEDLTASGEDTLPFDVFYWNRDWVGVPQTMQYDYLRHFYRDNLLARPDSLVLGGTKINLGRIETPTFFVGARTDHIAPWESVYRGTRLVGGPRPHFVVADTDHVTGIVNPPGDGAIYWSGSARDENPIDWLKNASRHQKSWWPEWTSWLRQFSGGEISARAPASSSLGDAPGQYARTRADD